MHGNTRSCSGINLDHPAIRTLLPPPTPDRRNVDSRLKFVPFLVAILLCSSVAAIGQGIGAIRRQPIQAQVSE